MDKVELNLLGEGVQEVVLREGDAKEIYEYRGFDYFALSTQSFIDLVKSKAVKENAVIAYTQEKMQSILNDAVVDRKADTITYKYQESQQWKEWEDIIASKNGCTFDQKQIIDFIRRREEGEIEGAEILLANLKNFKYATNITGDASYDDENNYNFAIKVGDVEGQTSLPKVICPNIEVFNESGFIQPMEVEIEVIKPKSNEEKLQFRLSCPKYSRYFKESVQHEVDEIKKQLEGYLIVTGVIY